MGFAKFQRQSQFRCDFKKQEKLVGNWVLLNCKGNPSLAVTSKKTGKTGGKLGFFCKNAKTIPVEM